MGKGKKDRPYKIVAAYDSETNNINVLGERVRAFPVLHQFGIIDPEAVSTINSQNVENLTDIYIYRRTDDAYAQFSKLITTGRAGGYVPVVMVHNLGFDMYALSEYLLSYDVRPLAKSSTKPITFTFEDSNGSPCLVIWDTLVFYQKPLATMGAECGYPKLSGSWDYNRQRTPYTELTAQELAYAKHDIYVMFAYLGYYLRQNPTIKPEKLAKNVMTKTGAVREKRKVLFDSVKGEGLRFNVGRFWNFQNRVNLPKTDDELFTMHACTRGGFTFCAGSSAGYPFDLDGTSYVVAGYDAASQHPAQMVSHFYPERFTEAPADILETDARIIECYPIGKLLDDWARPFPVAFNARFKFVNLRFKSGTVFANNRISPLAWARTRNIPFEVNPENEQGTDFKNKMQDLGYLDYAQGETHSFGKLESAETCILFLTELAFWEVCQVFDYDSFEALSGYETACFSRPTDMSVLSVMEFYRRKNVFKRCMNEYEHETVVSENKDALMTVCPENLALAMCDGTATAQDVKAYYQLLKADLNSLFGIEATNEAKQDMIMTADGIDTIGVPGLENLPDNPKAWYQFGQRIVGWSRIAQIVVMKLSEGIAEKIINGDTDSVKFLIEESGLETLDNALAVYGRAIDRARKEVTARVRDSYPNLFEPLDGIGWYEREFTVKRFCASWNKAYCYQTYSKKHGEMRFDFTLAGIATDADFVGCDDSQFRNSYNAFADYLYRQGWTFSQICSLLLGYNVTIDPSITKINGRTPPEWGERFRETVTDWRGDSYEVDEPAALALFAMPKTVGSIENEDNAINAEIAKVNNPAINTTPVLLYWEPGEVPEVIYFEED